MPNSITYLHQTPIFEWYVARCGPKNGYQKDIMCLKEIGLRAQNMLTILGPYDLFMSMRIFTLTMHKINIQTPKIERKLAPALIWIC